MKGRNSRSEFARRGRSGGPARGAWRGGALALLACGALAWVAPPAAAQTTPTATIARHPDDNVFREGPQTLEMGSTTQRTDQAVFVVTLSQPAPAGGVTVRFNRLQRVTSEPIRSPSGPR